MTEESRALTTTVQQLQPVEFDREKLEVLHIMYPKMTQVDERLFVLTCNRTLLDPFARQIFAVWRYSTQERKEIMATQVSIDGFRIQAERSNKYQGQVGPLWCGEDGIWLEAWIQKTPPLAAKVGIWRENAREPIWGVATYQEYCQKTREGNPNAMWGKMPATMLAKCAESLALRRALPVELAGLYTDDEMGQSDVIDHEPEAPSIRPAQAAPQTAQGRPEPRNVQSSTPEPEAPTAAPVAAKGPTQPTPQKLVTLGVGGDITKDDDPDFLRFREIREAGKGVGMDVSLPKLPFRRGQFVTFTDSLLKSVNEKRKKDGLDPFVPGSGDAEPTVIEGVSLDMVDGVMDYAVGGEIGELDDPTEEQMERIQMLAISKDVDRITWGEEILSISEIIANGITKDDATRLIRTLSEIPEIPAEPTEEDLAAVPF